VGETPGGDDPNIVDDTRAEDSRESLEDALKRAIEEEQYEEAGRIRDRLKSQF
jgi:protein-arginine kinase activator protein McsA